MKINYTTGNAAFEGDSSFLENVRILMIIIEKMKEGKTYGNILDINGNKVGTWEI